MLSDVESTRYVVENSTMFSGCDLDGFDSTGLDEWRSLVHSGELTARITEKTPQLARINRLACDMINSFYDQTLHAYYGGQSSLSLVQEDFYKNMERAAEIKALIEATPEDDVDEGYGYGIDADNYGV